MSNSVDPDETAHDEPFRLGLCCLQKPIIIACGSEKVKKKKKKKKKKIKETRHTNRYLGNTRKQRRPDQFAHVRNQIKPLLNHCRTYI